MIADAQTLSRLRVGLVAAGSALLMPSEIRAEDQPSPVGFEGIYTADGLANVSGGKRTGFRGMGKLSILADTDISGVGVPGAMVHVNLQHVHGESLSEELVGDGQVVSNIDAVSALRPMEAYVAFPFGKGGQGLIKAGLIDLNADFDVQSFGAFFLNSSHGIGADFAQSGLNGPSIFPTSASAFTVHWRGEGWVGRFGLFDAVAGDPDHPRRTVVRFPGETGALLVGELDVALGPAAEFQLGAWHYTTRFDSIVAPGEKGRSSGAYGMVEGVLARRGEAEFGAWVRVGIAADEVNPVGIYVGGGTTFGTDRRKIGLAFAHARLGDPALAAARLDGVPLRRAETAIELSYAHQLHERIVVQPDVQYIINPGWDPTLGNALVMGVRLHLALF